MEKEVYQKDSSDVISDLNSQIEGLFEEQVVERQKKYGLNQLEQGKKISPLKIFFRQFNDFIVWILIIAVLISFFLKEYIDATVILIILVLNAFFGFLQEYRAEKVIETLKKLTAL